MLCSKCNQSADVLTDRGLCPDCHMEAEERRSQIIDLAREQRQEEGLVEIDDHTQVSEGNDNGCYVAAWVWLDFADTKFDQEKGQESEPKPKTHSAPEASASIQPPHRPVHLLRQERRR